MAVIGEGGGWSGVGGCSYPDGLSGPTSRLLLLLLLKSNEGGRELEVDPSLNRRLSLSPFWVSPSLDRSLTVSRDESEESIPDVYKAFPSSAMADILHELFSESVEE